MHLVLTMKCCGKDILTVGAPGFDYEMCCGKDILTVGAPGFDYEMLCKRYINCGCTWF